MRSKIIAALAAVCLVAVGVGAALLNGGSEEYERYHQHREAQQLGDLSAEDQEAASSTNIDAETFASHLPVVSIDTRGQEVPGEALVNEENAPDYNESDLLYEEEYSVANDGSRTIATDVRLYDSNDSANRISDTPTIQAQAEIRYRGHSSRLFDKKSYAISFTESDRITSRDLNVLGMGEDNDWILYGPYLDKTLVRNYITMNIVAQFMPFVPDVRFCELFLNGEYQGLYLLMESVKVGDNRVNLTESDQRSVATSYLVKRDWDDIVDPSNVSDFLDITYNGAGVGAQIVYPTERDIATEQRSWIESDLNSIEKKLYSYDYDTSEYGYWTTLNVESFVDYFIVNELTINRDAGAYSTYLYKDVRGMLSIGPIWDFNNAYNNYMEADFSEAGFVICGNPMFYMLTKDEKFVEQVIQRYRELRASALSDGAVLSYIVESLVYIEPAARRNYEIWGYSFSVDGLKPTQKLAPDSRNPSSFYEAVDDLKQAFLDRGEWMDAYIENLRQFSHESAVKQYNH